MRCMAVTDAYFSRRRLGRAADREAHEAMGFHQGWGQCADQLAAPVGDGQWDEAGHRLAQLRLVCRAENALVEKDTLLVVDLKYRGPRFGRHYTTSPDCAYAVDVYLRERREWSY